MSNINKNLTSYYVILLCMCEHLKKSGMTTDNNFWSIYIVDNNVIVQFYFEF